MHIKLAVKRKLEQLSGYGIDSWGIFFLDILENYNHIFFLVLNDSDFHCNICESAKSYHVTYLPSSNKNSNLLQLYILMYEDLRKFILFLKLVILLHIMMNVQG